MEDKRNIFGKLCFITLRKAKTQLKHKTRFVQCIGDGAVAERIKRNFQSFLLEISHWTML